METSSAFNTGSAKAHSHRPYLHGMLEAAGVVAKRAHNPRKAFPGKKATRARRTEKAPRLRLLRGKHC